MYSKIYELLDNKPCNIVCAEWPFVIAVKCDSPWCVYSELLPVSEILNNTPWFCWLVTNCVQARFASPWADWQTIIQELVQDSIGDALEWFDYNDALNTWLQENPLSSADNISYDNTISLLTATNVQDAIDELISGNDIELYEDVADTWIRYTKANGDIINLKTGHAETITPVANVATTITHNLGTNKIVVQVYDSITWEMVDVQVTNRTATTVDIISTTVDDIEVVIKR